MNRQNRGDAMKLALAALLAAALVTLAGGLARDSRHDELALEAVRAAPLAGAVLGSAVEKQRSVPLILSRDTDVRAVLAQPGPEALAQTNRRLAQLAAETRASVIYLIDATGNTIAASNFAASDSFVGNNYAFRDYVARALAEGAAEQYALGTISNRPGLYISRRVDGPGGQVLGVVVAKVELDDVEATWAGSSRPTFVDDGRGIVLATSVPEWRFKALRPLDRAEAAGIRASIQSPDAGLAPLDMAGLADAATGSLVRVSAGHGRQAYVMATLPVPSGPPNWRIHVLVPAEKPLAQAALYWRSVTALVLALAAGALFFVQRRRRWAARRQQDLARTAEILERRVQDRTAELSAANARLQAESAEREAMEARVLRLRDDLAQANRLASLGQITAGVAHELNQPLAAIRAYAENAGIFVDRGDMARARGNLSIVADLTDRIGKITGTLRNFARRQPGQVQTMDIAEPIDGALMMLGSRIKQQTVRLERSAPPGPALVRGDKTRLEQVFVNLLRNALDAMDGTDGGTLSVTTQVQPEHIKIVVADTGPGLSDDMLKRLFTPFSTTRPNGLGLGLVITADILRDLGGAIAAGNTPAGGAALCVTLPRAFT